MRAQDTAEYTQMLNYMQEHPGEMRSTFTFPAAAPEHAGLVAEAAMLVMREIVGPLLLIRFGDEEGEE